jgi:hypothetical protein
MTSRITTILSATFLAATFATAAAAAQTPLPKPSPLAAHDAVTTDGSSHHDAATTGAAPRATTDGAAVGGTTSAIPQGNVACGLALGVDCGKVENWFPE